MILFYIVITIATKHCTRKDEMNMRISVQILEAKAKIFAIKSENAKCYNDIISLMDKIETLDRQLNHISAGIEDKSSGDVFEIQSWIKLHNASINTHKNSIIWNNSRISTINMLIDKLNGELRN